MPQDTADFERLIRDVRAGSQEAAWDLIERYGPKVLRVVRRRMPQQLRGEFDSADFVQAAWASVFAHRSRLVRFHKPAEFIAFMAAVARNKVIDQVRRRSQRPGASEGAAPSLDDSNARLPEARDTRQASPSQIVAARERWFGMLHRQPDHYRDFIQMRYAGATYEEIARRTGFDESTVRRAVHKILRGQR